jgi:hypothetical protein
MEKNPINFESIFINIPDNITDLPTHIFLIISQNTKHIFCSARQSWLARSLMIREVDRKSATTYRNLARKPSNSQSTKMRYL